MHGVWANAWKTVGNLAITGGNLVFQGLAQSGIGVSNPGTNYGALEILGELDILPSATTSFIKDYGLGWLNSYGGSVDTYDYQSASLLLGDDVYSLTNRITRSSAWFPPCCAPDAQLSNRDQGIMICIIADN